jgi:ribosomal protein S1
MEQSIVADADRQEIKVKQRFLGKVVKIGLAGAVLDIGIGSPAAIHISQLVSGNAEGIKRVEDVLQIGQEVEVWVKKIKDGRIELTMIKPLDLEWREIKKGMTVKGKVVRLEKFGAFVEIGAERPGLIHISEMAHGYVRQPSDVVKEEDEIEAMILEVNRKKKQIKLSIKALQPEPVKEVEEPSRPVKATRFTTDPSSQQPKEKPVRRKKARKPGSMDDSSADLLLSFEDQAQATEAEPTAMEIALRAAMEKAKVRKAAEKRKAKGVSQEQEDLLSRTLEQKVPTN